MGLTNIVNPFVTRDITPPPVPATATPDSEQNTVIICGNDGGALTFTGNWRLDISYYQIKKPKEKKKAQA